jgi:hypothetical protein
MPPKSTKAFYLRMGEASDIAVADTWVLGSPNREDSVKDLGTNTAIARTMAGSALLAELVLLGISHRTRYNSRSLKHLPTPSTE